MNLLLLNAASGSKLEQALEKLVDFGMDAGKDIFVAILIYSVGRFIIKQISVLIAKVLEKRKIETYNPQIQISAESETKRSIFREKDKTKRSKKESAQHSKSRNKSFVMTSVSAL